MGKRNKAWVVGLGALVIGTAGCRGNSKEGHFDVEPVVDVALGGRVPFSIRAAFGDERVRLSEVEASPARAVKVDGTGLDGEMMVHGLAVESGVEVAFSGESDGESARDSFSFDVLEVESLELPGACDEGVYFRGHLARIFYELRAREERRVHGLGVYPFDVSPADSLSLDEERSSLEAFLFEVSEDAPAEVRIASSLAGDRGDPESERILRVADARPIHLRNKPTVEGREYGKYDFDLSVVDDEENPICSVFHKRVTSFSPDVCVLTKDEVTMLDTLESSVEVKFIGSGSCVLRLGFPELGLEIPMSPIEVANVDSGGGDDWD